MSKLQELIRELCPDGVEYKKLGEVCDFINGFAFKSSLFHENGDRIIRITNIANTKVRIKSDKQKNVAKLLADRRFRKMA